MPLNSAIFYTSVLHPGMRPYIEFLSLGDITKILPANYIYKVSVYQEGYCDFFFNVKDSETSLVCVTLKDTLQQSMGYFSFTSEGSSVIHSLDIGKTAQELILTNTKNIVEIYYVDFGKTPISKTHYRVKTYFSENHPDNYMYQYEKEEVN